MIEAVSLEVLEEMFGFESAHETLFGFLCKTLVLPHLCVPALCFILLSNCNFLLPLGLNQFTFSDLAELFFVGLQPLHFEFFLNLDKTLLECTAA